MSRKPLTNEEGEVRELTRADMKAMKPLREGLPELYELLQKEKLARQGRGPQHSPIKQRISMRLDQDIVEYFKKTGPGWQSRINETLKREIHR